MFRLRLAMDEMKLRDGFKEFVVQASGAEGATSHGLYVRVCRPIWSLGCSQALKEGAAVGLVASTASVKEEGVVASALRQLGPELAEQLYVFDTPDEDTTLSQMEQIIADAQSEASRWEDRRVRLPLGIAAWHHRT